MKNKIMMCISLLIITLVIISVIMFPNLKDENNQKSNVLTGTILEVSNNSFTMQDGDNVIYTFFLNDIGNISVGKSLEITYQGKLNTKESKQSNIVLNYKVLENISGEVPDLWQDNGIFSKFYNYALKKLEDMTLDEKIGQILLVRVPEENQIETLKKYHFGGYLLFERDFLNKTKVEVISMIQSYQDNSRIPLLIAVDEEGGKVSRISSNSNLVEKPFKSSRELYQEGGFDLIHKDTLEKSRVLEELGINLNLAPVVDVSNDESDYMYDRSIGLSSELTSEYAKTVINASKLGHVSYTLKHFPGYGNNSDTHIGASIDTRSYEYIMKNDIPPFKAGIAVGGEAVLISHNVVSAIDDTKPASLSKNVHNLLRSNLGFTGIIITDDLAMNAVDPSTAVLDAILSGNDLLIVTDYEKSINQIKTALENNTLSEELIDKMAFRVLSWKYYKGLIIPNQK